MIRIGTTRRNYVAENVVDGARHPDLHFRRVPHAPLAALTRDPFWSGATVVAAPSSVDLVHLYNDVAWSSRPFVATFEDDYPRGRKSRRGFALGLAAARSNRCKALLAMSEFAANRFKSDPVTDPALAHKCTVVLPCVPRRNDAYARHLEFLAESRAGCAPVELLFVGVQFFRKGGEFVLDAIESLVAPGEEPIRLTLVTTFEPDGYTTPFDRAHADAVRARVARLPFVRLVERLSPDAVRDTMATSHALLFPTLDETFGFVAAEALATGLDVIGSRVRALPEILTAEAIGRAIDYETHDGIWKGVRLWRRDGREAFDRAYSRAREVAVETIRRRVRELVADRARLERDAPTLRAHYLASFTPEGLGSRLHDVYRRVLWRG